MKIRIMGTPRECDDAVKVLRLGFAVLEVSKLMEIAERHGLATPRSEPTPVYPQLLARAIGWFRR